MTHLDVRRWDDLLHGRLPVAEARALRQHLASGCELCEQRLVALGEAGQVDALDGMVDDTLLELAPAPAVAPVDELGFARIERTRRTARRLRWAGVGTLALAAASVALWLAVPPAPPLYRDKGPAVAVLTARLEVLQVTPQGPQLLGSGGRVEVGDTLVFRVQLDRAACVTLDVDASAVTEQPLCLAAGSHVLQRDGQVLGWTVERAGPLRLRLRAHSDAPALDAESRIELISGARAARALP